MKTIELKRIGKDSWDRPTYKDENGNYYKDVDLSPLGVTPKVLHISSPCNDIDGEPDFPVTNFVILNPPTENDIKQEKYKHQYMMLSRLQMDCNYYFGNGNRFDGHLWAGNIYEEIEEMKRLWSEIPEDIKPEWCTMGDILEYEKKI